MISNLNQLLESQNRVSGIFDGIRHEHLRYIYIPILIGFIPVNGDGRIYPTLAVISPTPTLSISLDSMHPPSPNQHSCSPSPLVFSMTSSVVLVSYFPSLQTPMLFSKHARHPSLTHARTISLHSL